jgi:hypothetical protein
METLATSNPEDFEETAFLQTIRIPKNLLFLTDKLPQKNYEKIPIKKNLSFSNAKNDDKGKIKLKKNTGKRNEKKDYSENKENRDKNYDNNDDDNNHQKKYAKNDQDSEEEITPNKRKKQHGSLDQSHLSGGNNAANIKVIKNIDNNHEINNSIVRDKSPHQEKERRIKEINSNNIHLPNIKNLGSVDDIRGGGRNK